MVRNPLYSAEIAKLIAALAGHMVTAFISLKHHPASVTPSEFVVVFKELRSALVAVSTVPRQLALPAEGNAADGTLHLFFRFVYESLAVFGGTHPYVLVLRKIQKNPDLVVLLLQR